MIRLKEREVVIVGGGLTAGLVARRLVPTGRDVLVLERGPERAGGAAEELPSQRDDLRWGTHRGLTQRENVETITLRHKPDEQALPMRRLTSFLPGYGVGGAISHWNGQTWRFQTTDYVLRSHLESRYGKAAVPADMTVQDWGLKYEDLEPYYTLFEQLFAISGEAGNVKGVRRPAGNPFEPYRSAPYTLPPLEPTEIGLMFRKAAASLGHHPFPMPAANASRAHRNPDGMQLGACQYCGHCERFMCEANAKSSAANLLFPLVRGKKNFEMRANAEVLRLVYDSAAKRVTGVVYADARTGEEYEQPAGAVVLGAYVFTNTRLLLLSGIGRPYDPRTGEGPSARTIAIKLPLRCRFFSRTATSTRSWALVRSVRPSTTSTMITSIIQGSASTAGRSSPPTSPTAVPSIRARCRPEPRAGVPNGRKQMPSGIFALRRSAATARATRTATTSSISIPTTAMPGAGR